MSQKPQTKEPPPPRLSGRHVILGVTGSIAAYKACPLARLLMAEGADLDVVMTRSATELVGPATFAGLTGKPALTEIFAPGQGGELHIELGQRTDLVVIAPATADVIARLAEGRANDLLTLVALATKSKILIAPAMHPGMWEHPATQRNVRTLLADGRTEILGPVEGAVASGEVGVGRMVEPEAIVDAGVALLSRPTLTGRHLVVTAGPTAEDIDPVRTLSNRSSGKLGFALAARAAARGAKVTLLSGPVAIPTPPGVSRVDIRGALALRSALWQALRPDLSGADALVMAAAVADYRPAQAQAQKIKRSDGTLTLELVQNPDLLAEIGQARKTPRPLLVGFALETEDDRALINRARQKLAEKRVDLMVANRADEALERDEMRAFLVTPTDARPLESMPKTQIADAILDYLGEALES